MERKTDHFDDDTEDHEWLKVVGKKRWIVLTKDRSLTHNFVEIAALLKSNTHCFVLTTSNATGDEMASALVKALPDIFRIVSTNQPPIVAKVTISGRIRITHTYSDLVKDLEAAEFRESQKPEPK